MTDPMLPQSYDYELPYPPVPKRSEQDFGDMVFRLFRTQGGRDFGLRLWLWTSLLLSLLYLIAIPLLAGPYIDMMRAVLELDAIGPDPEAALEGVGEVFSLLGRIMLPIIALAIGAWAVIASGEAALHRRIFHGEDAPRLPLRFGKDELRVMFAQFLVYLIVTGVYIGMILLTALTLGIGGIVAIPGGLFLMVLFMLRFSSAAALSVKDRRFRFGESKGVTQYRKGTVFGAYALITVLGYVVMTVIQLLFMYIVLGSGGLEAVLADMANETFDSNAVMERLNSPLVIFTMIIGIIVYSAVMALWYLSFSGVGASTVLWWMRDRELPPTEWELAAQTPQAQEPPAL